MVEMLGVLAIIGVLSVSGIYGYNMAMRHYKANEIAQTVAFLYTMARSANGGEGTCMTLSSTALGTKVAGVDVDIMVDTMMDPVQIHIQMADSHVCSAIEKMFPGDDYVVECNDDVDCDA